MFLEPSSSTLTRYPESVRVLDYNHFCVWFKHKSNHLDEPIRSSTIFESKALPAMIFIEQIYGTRIRSHRSDKREIKSSSRKII